MAASNDNRFTLKQYVALSRKVFGAQGCVINVFTMKKGQGIISHLGLSVTAINIGCFSMTENGARNARFNTFSCLAVTSPSTTTHFKHLGW